MPRVRPTPPGGNEFLALGNSPLKRRIHRKKVDIHRQKGRYPIAENNIHRQKATYTAILPLPAFWQCMMTYTAKKGRGRRCTKHDQKSECSVSQALEKHADSTPEITAMLISGEVDFCHPLGTNACSRSTRRTDPDAQIDGTNKWKRSK